MEASEENFFIKESSQYFKTFTTIDDMLDAISEGIDSFLELYNIQNNRNIVSESLSSVLHSFNLAAHFVNPLSNEKKKIILLNTLYKREWKRARRKKVSISMLKSQGSDEDKISFLQYFGRKLNETEKNKNITSHYSFCLLGIYNKCFIDPTFLLGKETIQSYIMLCLTPRTRMPTTLKDLFTVLSERLTNVSQNDFTGISRKQLTITQIKDLDKADRQDCVFFKFSQGEEGFAEIFNNYYSTKEKEQISSLVNRIESHLDFDEDSKSILEDVSKNFFQGFLNINNISSGVREYVKKFDENTGTNFLRNDIEQSPSGYSKSYLLDIAESNLENELKKITAIGGVAEIFFSPAQIANLANYIVSTLISIATQTKSYGSWNRHGITGQIRAFLIKNQLLNTLERFKLNYSYMYYMLSFRSDLDASLIDDYFSRMPEIISDSYNEADLSDEEKRTFFFTSIAQRLSNEVSDFFLAYEKAIKVLPNINKKGSLAYYLNMFAKPNNGGKFSLNHEEVNKWIEEKLGERNLLNIPEEECQDGSREEEYFSCIDEDINYDDIHIVGINERAQQGGEE